MIILIDGIPGSGKSELAESLVMDISDPEHRYYLATMIAYDEQGMERIGKHRNLREGKSFKTIELPYGVNGAVDMMEDSKHSTVLLECIANLVGNEIHENRSRQNKEPEVLAREVFEDIKILGKQVLNLIIVTNHFDDKEDYDDDTRNYIKAISSLNELLYEYADRVEVITGEK